MKRSVILCALTVALTWGPAHAQVISSDKMFPDQLAKFRAGGSTEVGAQKNVLVLLPTVPVTFNTLQRDAEGKWRMGAAMTMGFGTTLLLGKGTFEGQKTSLQPWVIAGAALNAGVHDDPEKGVTEALMISGFLGFGNVAINVARELLDGDTTFGLALKVDVLTNLAPDAYMCLRGGCPK